MKKRSVGHVRVKRIIQHGYALAFACLVQQMLILLFRFPSSAVQHAHRLCLARPIYHSQGPLWGKHSFVFKPIDGNKTEVIQSEEFVSVLCTLMKYGSWGPETLKGFESFNQELKQRCEAKARGETVEVVS